MWALHTATIATSYLHESSSAISIPLHDIPILPCWITNSASSTSGGSIVSFQDTIETIFYTGPLCLGLCNYKSMGEMSNFAGVTVNTKNEHKTKVSSAIHNVILISFQMQVPIILSEDDKGSSHDNYYALSTLVTVLNFLCVSISVF